MDPPSHSTAAAPTRTAGSSLVPTTLKHSARPHAPHLLNRSQSEDSGHLSLSTEHARFTHRQAAVDRVNQDRREGTSHDASYHQEPVNDDARDTVSAADALALIQFSRSERYATYSPVTRQVPEAIAANHDPSATASGQKEPLDAPPSPLLSAAAHIISNGSKEQGSVRPWNPPGPHVFSTARADTMTELFGPPVPSGQSNESNEHHHLADVQTAPLRSSLSMSVFEISQPAHETDAQSFSPRSPPRPPTAPLPVCDSETTGGNTAELPAPSLHSSGMSQYIDLSGMQNHQRQPPTTAAVELTSGAVARAATVAESAPMSPAAPATAQSFSRVASGPASPMSPCVSGKTDDPAKNQVTDCPSQAAMWTPHVRHQIPDPVVFGSPRPPVAPSGQVEDYVSAKIATDFPKEKPKKLVAPPLRRRTIASPTGYPREILEVLESHFEKCSHLCRERAEMIGREAGGLEKFRVDNWFHNRRKNYKKRGYELKCDPNECVDIKLKTAKPPATRKKSASSTRQSSSTNLEMGGTSAVGKANSGASANASNPAIVPSLSALFQSIMANSVSLSRFHLAPVTGASAGFVSAGPSASGNARGPVSQVSASALPLRMQAQTFGVPAPPSAHVSQQPLQHPADPGLNPAAPAKTHGEPHFTQSQAPPGLHHHPMIGLPLAPPAFPLYPTNGQVASYPPFPAWPMTTIGTSAMSRPSANASLPSGQQSSSQAPPPPFMSPASYYSMINVAHLMQHHPSAQVPGSATPTPMQFPITHSPFVLVHPRSFSAAAGGTATTTRTTTVTPLSSMSVSSLVSDTRPSNSSRSLSQKSTSTNGEASERAEDRAKQQEQSTLSTASSSLVEAHTARSSEGLTGERPGAASVVSSESIIDSHAKKRKADEEATDDSLSPNQAKRPRHLLETKDV